jgi:pimeloyl-ACP methyl ester carboxylesterase
MPYQKKYQDVHGRKIAYVEEGEGDPIVLLHGNPTSSYLWRNVIPELVGGGRVVAPARAQLAAPDTDQWRAAAEWMKHLH